MRDGLEGSLAVADEDVDSLAGNSRATHRARQAMPDRPYVRASGGVEIFKATRVGPRHDEKMAPSSGVSVHEREDDLILKNDTGLAMPGSNIAEDASAAG